MKALVLVDYHGKDLGFLRQGQATVELFFLLSAGLFTVIVAMEDWLVVRTNHMSCLTGCHGFTVRGLRGI